MGSVVLRSLRTTQPDSLAQEEPRMSRVLEANPLTAWGQIM